MIAGVTLSGAKFRTASNLMEKLESQLGQDYLR